MAEKEDYVFTDPGVIPERENLMLVLGERMELWDKLMDHIDSGYSNSEKIWRYYRDGGQWLFRMLHKKKTVFWSSVNKDTFRVTFYFGGKAEPVVMGSDLPVKVKEAFRTGQSFGAMKPLSVKVMEEGDLDLVYKLIVLKTSIR